MTAAVVEAPGAPFVQGPYLRRVHPTIQWAKLSALAEGAKLATQRLDQLGRSAA